MPVAARKPEKPRPWWRERSVHLALALWIAGFIAVLVLAQGSLPFNRPMLATLPYRTQLLVTLFQPVLPFILMAVTYLLTRRRVIPDMASRAPVRSLAARETLLLWLYGALVLGVGQIVGRRLFGEGIGLHLNGSLFGATRIQTPQEVWFWAGYNFLLYALVPYSVFRARGYSREALNLKSANLKNDTLVIFVVLALESAAELSASGIFKLNGHQLMTGALLSFVVHLLGTGLPVMIFIYSILLPRYLRITGSAATTVLLGALSYAVLHLFEYWTVYDSFRHALLSVIVVVLTFIGPGLIKSYLTLRTGNAWVHLWAYHAIAPHVTADTPVVVKIFHIH
jgi:hypothetical protein